MSSVAYVMLFGAGDRSCQQAIGTSITTKLQHIPGTRFRLSLLKKKTDFGGDQGFSTPCMPVFFSRPKIGYFSNNENSRRALNLPHSNAAYHQLTLLIGGKNSSMRVRVQGRLMQVLFIEIHQVFEKKKGRILFQQGQNFSWP